VNPGQARRVDEIFYLSFGHKLAGLGSPRDISTSASDFA
jgi:hypothetical protein